MRTSIKNNTLIIELDLDSGKPSSSGKTLIIGGTGGFIPSGLKYNDSPVSISVNATIPNPEFKK
jgi:hypothetical protein